jgi:hypothetical protein
MPPALRLTGWLHVGLALAALVLLPFDERLVTGISPWIKPLKFCLSITLYVWSLGVLLSWLPAAEAGRVRWLSAGVAATMILEIGCLFLQAARGTTSHYNTATAFDGAVFGLMGVLIGLNTLLNVAALALVWGRPLAVAPAVAWGARLGLLLFIGGAVLGGLMIRARAHTVGAPDGGPGLPLIGWSRQHCDLRAAHFLGMHALQILPLLGWGLTRAGVPPTPGVAVQLAAALGWAALVAAVLLRALAGRALYIY